MGRNSRWLRSKIALARVRAHQRIFDFCLHLFTFCPQLVDNLHDKCEGFTLAAFTPFCDFPLHPWLRHNRLWISLLNRAGGWRQKGESFTHNLLLHSSLSVNGQQGEGKNRKLADARTRARGISFTSFLPSPSPFVFVEKARCFSQKAAEYFQKIAVSSDNIFQSTPTSTKLPIKRLRVYRRKSIVDPDKNLSLKHQKQSSSNE